MLDFSHITLKPNEIDMVLYHGDCIDGYACAFVCYLYMKMNNIKRKISYIPCQHQKSPPIVTDKNILICDFSYKNTVLKNLLKTANKLCILDHHVSAEKDLSNIPEKNKLFNKNHSGCYITWAYFFGEKNIPLLIQYIQDNDIGRWSLPNVKAFSSYIFNVEKKFEKYERLLDDNYIINNILPIGEGIQNQNDFNINEGVKKACVNFMLINNTLYFVVNINTSILKSEIGNAVFNSFPNANFAISWSTNGHTNETYCSLRSIKNGTDVEKIATMFNGGGHIHAAGLTIFNSSTLPGILLDRHQTYTILDRINVVTQNIMEDFPINIVYLNCTHNKRYIGKYLLQTRYEETYENKKREVSEACSIIRNRDKDPTYYIGIDIACIFYYDYSTENTYFSVCSDNLDILTMMKEYYQEYVVDTNDVNISHRLKLKLKGLKKKI